MEQLDGGTVGMLILLGVPSAVFMLLFIIACFKEWLWEYLFPAGVILSAGIMLGLFSGFKCVKADVGEETVIESIPIVAFEHDESLTGDARGFSFLFYGSMRAGFGEERSYIVMEDEAGDGGLIEKSYPSDGTRVYEDADEGSARVEKVKVVSQREEITFFGMELKPVEHSDVQTRIHVPEGTLDMARLAGGQQGE